MLSSLKPMYLINQKGYLEFLKPDWVSWLTSWKIEKTHDWSKIQKMHLLGEKKVLMIVRFIANVVEDQDMYIG